jgi:hypothetical protein
MGINHFRTSLFFLIKIKVQSITMALTQLPNLVFTKYVTYSIAQHLSCVFFLLYIFFSTLLFIYLVFFFIFYTMSKKPRKMIRGGTDQEDATTLKLGDGTQQMY